MEARSVIFEVPIGLDHDLHRALHGRGAVVVLDAELRAVERADVGAAPHVVARDIQLEVGEPVAQEDHPLARIGDVLAMRVFLDQIVEGVERLLGIDRRAARQVDVEPALQEVRLALEIDHSLHVVGVVDPGIGRVFADEGIGRIDRRIDFAILVVGVDQVDLRLARGLAEGKARLQILELLDRLAVARILHALLGPGVHHFRAGFGVVDPMATASGSQHGQRTMAMTGSPARRDGNSISHSLTCDSLQWVDSKRAAVYPMPRR